MVETNLLGAMTATEVFLDQLRDGGGDLVNVSSVAGRVAPGGLRRLRRDQVGDQRLVRGAARQELQPDIRVTVIEPGASGPSSPTTSPTPPASEPPSSDCRDWRSPREDIADVIAFAVSRPQRVTLNEILVRPTAQAM